MNKRGLKNPRVVESSNPTTNRALTSMYIVVVLNVLMNFENNQKRHNTFMH